MLICDYNINGPRMPGTGIRLRTVYWQPHWHKDQGKHRQTTSGPQKTELVSELQSVAIIMRYLPFSLVLKFGVNKELIILYNYLFFYFTAVCLEGCNERNGNCTLPGECKCVFILSF